MHRKRLTNGQVLLGSLGFILLMGLVGTIDRDSQQALIEERVAIRDAIDQAIEEDQRIWTAHYEMRAKP